MRGWIGLTPTGRVTAPFVAVVGCQRYHGLRHQTRGRGERAAHLLFIRFPAIGHHNKNQAKSWEKRLAGGKCHDATSRAVKDGGGTEKGEDVSGRPQSTSLVSVN